MSSRRTLILFVIALLALGAFFLVELPRRRGADRERAGAARLFVLDPRAVDGIAIEQTAATIRLALTGARWTMLEPVLDDAEAASATPVVSNLAQATVQRDLGTEEDLSRYGLAPPFAVVTLTAAGETVARLELGDYTVDRSAVFARHPDGRVILVPTSVRRAVDLAPDDFRNRRVVVFDLAVVRSFEIDSRLAGRSTWARAGADDWFTVIAGDTVRGDSIAVPSVLRRLRGMRVRAFAAVADTAPPPPLLVVTIRKDDGSAQSVRFFGRPGGVFHARVSGNPRVVEVADDPSDIARASPATLRDRRLLHFDPAPARRISLSTPDTSAVIVRAGDRWALPNPALGVIDPGRAADFVRSLRSLSFVRPSQARAPTDARPAFSLVVYGAGDTILDELHAAPSPGGAGKPWVARSRSLGVACDVEADELDDIVARLRRLRR